MKKSLFLITIILIVSAASGIATPNNKGAPASSVIMLETAVVIPQDLCSIDVQVIDWQSANWQFAINMGVVSNSLSLSTPVITLPTAGFLVANPQFPLAPSENVQKKFRVTPAKLDGGISSLSSTTLTRRAINHRIIKIPCYIA